MLPWPVCPLAGHARLGQNVVAGSMRILLSWLCWGACQEGVCLDPHFHCNCTSPRFSGELPVVVLEVVALIFERIERLIFDLPPCPPTTHEGIDSTLGHPQIGHPTEVLHVVAADLPILDKIDQQLRVRGIEGNLIDKAKPMHDVC